MNACKLTALNACKLIAVLLLACVVPVHAAKNSPDRVRAFAALPDWTGIWERDVGIFPNVSGRPPLEEIQALRSNSKLAGHPPYNKAWEARYQDSLKKATDLGKSCSYGFPSVMESPRLFQIAVAPEQTIMVFAHQEVRYIHTDGRSHPSKDDLWPTPMGHSIGRWEGETLIIETIARTPARLSYLASLAPLSEEVRFTERIRLAGDRALENQLTIHDPVAFTRPWQLTLKYRKVTDLDRMIHYDCTENDRNPVEDGKVIIAPR
jgi:hypothetical protein